VKVYAIYDVTHTTLQDAARTQEREKANVCIIVIARCLYESFSHSFSLSLSLSLAPSLFLYVQLLYVRSSCQTGMK
jgi:hypothetical protein